MIELLFEIERGGTRLVFYKGDKQVRWTTDAVVGISTDKRWPHADCFSSDNLGRFCDLAQVLMEAAQLLSELDADTLEVKPDA